MSPTRRVPGPASALPCLLLAGCGERDPRGSVAHSEDVHTWRGIADDDGDCKPLLADGKPWKHAKDAHGRIPPGSHTICCETALDPGLTVTIPAGMVHTFDD